MYQISLFTGAMGGDLATVHLLGWRPVLYCEIDKYCQSLIRQRIKDGFMPDAPIWGDIRTLRGRILEPYRGLAEKHPLVITAGFPCQPWSVAGKQKGERDDRNLWPDTVRVVREVRPRFVFLENVPNLLAGSHGYFGQILGELAESGYDVRWCVLSAAGCGAPHLRKRLWVLAYACNSRWWQLFQQNSESRSRITSDFGSNGKIQSVAYANAERLQGQSSEVRSFARRSWWEVEPELGRVADGISYRLE